MDQDAGVRGDGTRPVLCVDEGWPELQIRSSRRADMPAEARFFRLTFPEPGKIVLKVGPGDHTVQAFELSKDQLRGLVLDAMPELLR